MSLRNRLLQETRWWKNTLGEVLVVSFILFNVNNEIVMSSFISKTPSNKMSTFVLVSMMKTALGRNSINALIYMCFRTFKEFLLGHEQINVRKI